MFSDDFLQDDLNMMMSDFADITIEGEAINGFVEDEEEIDEEIGTTTGKTAPYFYSAVSLPLETEQDSKVLVYKGENWIVSTRTTQNGLHKHKIVKMTE